MSFWKLFQRKKKKHKCTKYLLPEIKDKKSRIMKETLEELRKLVEDKEQQPA